MTPGTARVKAGGRTTLTAAVTVTGATAPMVKVCATVSGKARGKVKPAGCRTLRNINSGRTTKAALPIATARKAKGSYLVRVVASGPGFRTVNSSNKIKVVK
ncbi:MAG: hypothetical protein KDB48_01565 [Solirubrobacterales bacterium]|nr:hypothetical protein [Solirubrobacterales bacterium]